MKKILVTMMTGCALLATLHARTWTSADGKKTFEGEVNSYDSTTGQVTVRLSSGKSMTFPQDKLSEEDVKFLTTWEAEKNKPSPAELLAAQEVGQKLSKAKIHQLQGKRLKRVSMETAPEYYILYFSASW